MIANQFVRSLARSAKLAAPALTARMAARRLTTARSVIVNKQRLVVSSTSKSHIRQYSSQSLPDHQVIGMPALSPTMTQGNVGQWQKQVGDRVEPGDVLVEIETDKAQMDFEFQEEGYLAKILAPTGSKDLGIDTPIAIVVEDEADVAAFKDYSVDQAKQSSTPAAAPAKEEGKKEKEEEVPIKKEVEKQASADDRIFASPLAKALAREKNLDLKDIKGTGPRGRIVKADIEAYVASAPAKKKAAPAAPSKKAAEPTAAPAAATSAGYTDIPLTNMRKVIASRLTESKSTVPHYYLQQTINMDNINKLRQSLNQSGQGAYKLSVNDFVIKASASALRDVPEVNSSWQGEFIRQHHHADIAVATATPSGLITPIVRTCDAKGLRAISGEVKELAGRARANKLKPEEFQGGSFTISNLGMYGISSFSAIINAPHGAILAVGASEPKLVADKESEKGFKEVQTMSVQLSADHRVVDGAVGAQFLKAFKGYMENPLTLLL